jgi:hypothetical protein
VLALAYSGLYPVGELIKYPRPRLLFLSPCLQAPIIQRVPPPICTDWRYDLISIIIVVIATIVVAVAITASTITRAAMAVV